MKRFRFALRPVAVLRAHRAQLAEEAFGRAVQRQAAAAQVLAGARARVAGFEAALLASRGAGGRAAQVAYLLAGYQRECTAERGAEEALAIVERELQQRRAEHLEAHRGMKAVQRLEEQARQTHVAAQQRAEQAELDDLSGRRSVRSLAPGAHARPGNFTA